MKNKINIQWNKIFHLEDSMVVYGIYNSYTLEKLINTVHKIHNITTWNEKIFACKPDHWCHWYLLKGGVGYFAINSLLYLTIPREKYIKMYEKCNQSVMNVWQGDRNSFEELFTHFTFATIKIARNVRQSQKGYSDYKPRLWYRLHLYYDMKLVMLGINKDRSLNSSISSFCTTINTASTNTVSNWNSISSNYISE